MDLPFSKRYLSGCLIVVLIRGLLISPVTRAAVFQHSEGYIGEVQKHKVGKNESLIEIARKFDLGFNAIVAANPGVDPFLPRPGTIVTIPTAWILPVASTRPIIIVNLPEYRLYYLPKEATGTVVTFPLGIGDEGTDTPVGDYTIVEKIAGPSWYVPESMRRKGGLPKVVPPGPDNPMGSHALRLSRDSILIHGTNRPWGIGRRSSHGCLRLYPEDILTLFDLAQKGMRVLILNQPVKIGTRGDRVFVEAHEFEGEEPTVGEAMHALSERNLLVRTDFSKLLQAFAEKKGVPVDVTLAHLPSARHWNHFLCFNGLSFQNMPRTLCSSAESLTPFISMRR